VLDHLVAKTAQHNIFLAVLFRIEVYDLDGLSFAK
jgi:hypothetical protein